MIESRYPSYDNEFYPGWWLNTPLGVVLNVLLGRRRTARGLVTCITDLVGCGLESDRRGVLVSENVDDEEHALTVISTPRDLAVGSMVTYTVIKGLHGKEYAFAPFEIVS